MGAIQNATQAGVVIIVINLEVFSKINVMHLL